MQDLTDMESTFDLVELPCCDVIFPTESIMNTTVVLKRLTFRKKKLGRACVDRIILTDICQGLQRVRTDVTFDVTGTCTMAGNRRRENHYLLSLSSTLWL